MLIYGQNDPWTAGAVDLGAASDSFKFIAPAANHGASIAALTDADESAATATVLRWAGIAEVAEHTRSRLKTGERTVEQEELELRHRR
jgi:hypothetical protein